MAFSCISVNGCKHFWRGQTSRFSALGLRCQCSKCILNHSIVLTPAERPIAIAIKWNWKLILSVDTVLLILLLNVRKQTHFIYCSPENRKCLYSNNKYFQSCLRAGDAGQQYHGENITDYVSAHSNSYFSRHRLPLLKFDLWYLDHFLEVGYNWI